jgi:acyl-CoA thioester hydrolase
MPDTGVIAPILAWRGVVQSDWIDPNEHMTSMAYPPLFHANTKGVFRPLGISVAYITERGLSVFQREFRLGFERELRRGDPIEIRSWLIGHDAKRLHHFHELWHCGDGYRAAFAEYMSLHVDMATRRTAPFPHDVQERLEAMAAAFREVARPSGVGAAIGLSPGSRQGG